jgi:MoxR-like ATPase
MNYTKIFDPMSPGIHLQAAGSRAEQVGQADKTQRIILDRRDGRGYVYDEKIVLLVNVALATGRPILVSGPSGSGKSSVAASVAFTLGWSYYEHVISSRTQARDLLWQFDTLRRLSAAGHGDVADAREMDLREIQMDFARFIRPGVLWWAYNPDLARRRGIEGEGWLPFPLAEPPGLTEGRDKNHAVILLDEIDKADPDMPNDLLVAVGSFEFQVDEIGATVKILDRDQPPLIIITTNGERELPAAFLRRCLTLKLEAPDVDRLVLIARSRFGEISEREPVYKAVAEIVKNPPAYIVDRQSPPSTAEFLDAIDACLTLGVQPVETDSTWVDIARSTLWKART